MDDKIVKFEEWCPTCRYSDKPETENPCNECLHYPANDDRRPERYWPKTGEGNDGSSK